MTAVHRKITLIPGRLESAMSGDTPDRKQLIDLWLERVSDARMRVEFARNFVQEVQRDCTSGNIPEKEAQLEYTQALRIESLAFAEYNRVLCVFTDLILHGVIPDESEWLKSQAMRAGGSESEPEP